MRKITSFLLVIVILLTSALEFSCKERTFSIEDIEHSCYGNFDYSLKPYFSGNSQYGYAIYNDTLYYVSHYHYLMSISLLDLNKNMKTYERSNDKELLTPDATAVCPNPDHKHSSMEDDCMAYIGENMQFLLDAHESNGSSPIIYYTFVPPREINKSEWNRSEPIVLYRYDTGTSTREKLTEFYKKPIRMMSYGDDIYITMQVAKNGFEIYKINKKTGKEVTLPVGEDTPELITADERSVYYAEMKSGAVYRADRELSTTELIFTVPSMISVPMSEHTTGIRVDGGYIYYRADFGTVDYTYASTLTYALTYYNIRRVPLSDTGEKSEIVAEKVLQAGDIGISGNKFYFTPCDPKPSTEGFDFNFNNGRLCAVDLDTLVCTDVLKDSGLLFQNPIFENSLVNENCYIGRILVVSDNGYKITRGDSASYISGYNFSNGDIYNLFNPVGGVVIIKPRD